MWRIVLKDLRILIVDRRTLTLLVAMPFLLMLILGLAAGRQFSSKTDSQLTLLVVDRCQTPLSRDLVRQFDSMELIRVESTEDLETAHRLAEEADLGTALVIGKGFQAAAQKLELIDLVDFPNGRLSRGLQSFDIQVVHGSILPWAREPLEQMLYYGALQVLVPATIERFALVRSYIRSYRARHPLPEVPSAARPMVSFVPPADVIYRTLVPSFVVMFTFFLINIMAFSFVAEWNQGTMQRIQVAPLGGTRIVLGKVLPFFIVSVCQAMLLLAAGYLLFGMPLGEYPAMLLVPLLATSACAASLGFLVAALVRSEAQVTSLTTLIVLGMAAVSGGIMPRMWMPALMRQISLYVAPGAWSLVAYHELLRPEGPELSRVWSCGLMLLLFAAAYFGAGLFFFRKRLRSI